MNFDHKPSIQIAGGFFLFICTVIICLFLTIPSAASAASLAKATVVVVDEEGSPIEDAKVFITRDGPRWDGTVPSYSRGETNSSGRYSDTMISHNGYITYGAKKEGYYNTHHNFQFDYNKAGLKHWKPWNPELEVVLRKIENPVPMYARNTIRSNLVIPVIGTEVGFDLIRFDWVSPYGRGVHADFVFKLDKTFQSRKDFKAKLTLSFTNKHDGIIEVRESLRKGSDFHLPRVAVETGYRPVLELEEWREPEGQIERNYDFIAKDINYFFRIRSEGDGALEKALYGKILGHLSYDPIFTETAKIYFKYYLNPEYNRNLEYDPNQNLFGGLSSLEKVGIK